MPDISVSRTNSSITTVVIIKIGGNVIDDAGALEHFLTTIAALRATLPQGNHLLIAHGGGKLATELGARLGIEATMVDGRRITNAATLEIVTMVYGGLVNKRIVAGLQAHGVQAIGLTGADANIIQAHKRQHPSIDYGFVGDIDCVETAFLLDVLSKGITPVIAPLTHDGHGSMLNTNADTMASAIAVALASSPASASARADEGNTVQTQLVYCFEKKGVLASIDDEHSVLPVVTQAEYGTLKKCGIIAKGMIPKMDNAFRALEQGVSSVRICHAVDVQRALVQGDVGSVLRLA